MRGTVDYDALWTAPWGDVARFGPTPRHIRRIIGTILDNIHFTSVLDVGCGDGSLLYYISKRFPHCHLAGLDVSSVAIERARRNLPGASFFAGEVSTLLAADAFDLVVCTDVIEHIKDDVAFLKDLTTLSKRYVLCCC